MAQTRNFHEDLKRDEHIHMPSDRTFGLASGGILFFVGMVKLLTFGWIISYLFLITGSIFAVLGFYRPALLTPVKYRFIKIAPVVARFLNPLMMGLIYLVCFIPGGLIMKLLRHDPLNRNFDPYLSSYWTTRENHELPDPMKYQF